MRNSRNRIVLLILVAALVLILTGCGEFEIKDDPAVRSDADVFLDALVAGDADAAYAAVYSGIDRTQFDTGFSQMCAYVQDVEEYTLEPIYYNYSSSNGTVTIQLTYRMTTEQGSFIVTASRIEGYEGLAAVHIVPEEQTTLHHTGTLGNMEGAGAVQWAVLALGALTWVFVIWMFVDCSCKKIRKKALWLVLIALGALVLTLTMRGGSVNLRFNVGLYLQLSSLIRYGDGSSQLSLVVPVGAIVYCAMRKRLEANATPAPQPEMTVLASGDNQVSPFEEGANGGSVL